MDIGITLPNGAVGISGPTLVEWGVRAEAAGFSVLGAVSRLAYPTHDELITLAAVAGATSRIRLMTTVLIGPTREPVLLAKEAATLDRISGGRFVLGMGVGAREDDSTIAGRDHAHRGKDFDEMLETMHRVWSGDGLLEGSREASPPPTNGRNVPIYFGGNLASKTVARRIARWGDGFIAAGSPQMVQPIVDAALDAWERAGRDGRPRLVAASYFALGDDAIAETEHNVREYYDSFMPGFGDMAAAAIVKTPDIAKRYLDAFEAAGFDEFLFSANSSDVSQVERLAEAVLR